MHPTLPLLEVWVVQACLLALRLLHAAHERY